MGYVFSDIGVWTGITKVICAGRNLMCPRVDEWLHVGTNQGKEVGQAHPFVAICFILYPRQFGKTDYS